MLPEVVAILAIVDQGTICMQITIIVAWEVNTCELTGWVLGTPLGVRGQKSWMTPREGTLTFGNPFLDPLTLKLVPGLPEIVYNILLLLTNISDSEV